MCKSFNIFIFFVFLFSTEVSHSQIITTEKDSIKAVQLYNSGRELARDGFNTEAIDTLLACLDIRKRIFGETNYRRLATTYYLVGITYKNLGLYNLAIRFTEKAENAYIEVLEPGDIRMTNIYLNLGNIYRDKLDFNSALRYFNQMLKVYENQTIINKEDISRAYYSIAEINYLKTNYEEAIKISLNYLDQAGSDDKIDYYNLIAASNQQLGNIEEASTYYQKAINCYENEEDAVFEFLNYATFLIFSNKFDLAEETLNRIYSIIVKYESENGEDLSNYYQVMGYFFENKQIESNSIYSFEKQKHNNLLEAITWYNKALDAIRFPINIENLDINSANPISQMESLVILRAIADIFIQISEVFKGKNQVIYAESIYNSLDYYGVIGDLVQRYRKEISSDEGRIALAGIEQSNIIDIVEVSFKAYEINSNIENLEIAFKNAEQLKSSSVFDKLSAEMAAENSLIPDSLLEKERSINSLLTKYTETRNNSQDSENTEQLDLLIFKLREDRAEYHNFLETNFNDYYELKYSNNFLRIIDIQQKLKKDEVLIEYVLSETDSTTNLYTITISSNNYQFFKQNLDFKFIKDIEDVFQFMSSPRYLFTKNADSKKFCVSSHNLYNRLIAPIKNEIKDKKIIIVPDGKLNYVAFDALIESLPDTSSKINFVKLDYLLKKHIVNYAYSANLHFKFDKKSKTAKYNFLAFAPEYLNDSISINDQKISVPSLPGTQKEVNLISKKFKTSKFIKENATEINFRNNCEDHDMIHLAMHAYISDSIPSMSKFVFTQNYNTTNINEDGLVTAADIYNLKLNARLTVLSACNTGRGKLSKGEGVMSLARGFLYAGCPSIVMTYWEVEDNSGTQIINSFYRNIKRGKPKDESLQLAKIKYIENANPRMSHPHYWLGFVSIGDNSPLYRSYDFYFFGLLIFAIIGIILDQIVRLKKARNKLRA